MPFHFTCEQCGAPFTRRSRLAWGKPHRFCSLLCYANSLRFTPDTHFWPKVQKSSTCWSWTGWTSGPARYGMVGHGGKSVLAHRLAWELASDAPVPEGMWILHTCDNPPCVRNDDHGVYVLNGVEHERWGHLWLGTLQDNAADMVNKGRSTTGNKNGSRTKPENLLRGDHHPLRVDPSRAARGVENGNAKLTDDLIHEIRQRYEAGERMRPLARAIGVSRTTIKNVVRGKTWKHVT